MKMVKKILPLLCAVVLIIGSSMTVFASSYILPKNLPSDSNWIILEVDDAMCNEYGYRYALYYCNGKIGYDKTTKQYFALTSAGSYSAITLDFSNPKNITPIYNAVATNTNYTYKLVASNSNIYYGTYKTLSVTDEVFYKAPLIVVKQAEALTGTVQAQVKVILPIAVGCLALLIGSIVLLPRLRSFL